MSKAFQVYKSSAGSGKTFSLTVEYLKLALVNPREFGRIMAMTFTIKASQEMKTRILEAATAIAQSNELPLTGRNEAIYNNLLEDLPFTTIELQRQAALLQKEILHNYTDFAISTIDSFSHRLVRSFAFELNLPVNFAVELDQDLIAEMVVDRFMDQIGHNKPLTKFLEKVFLQHIEDKENTDLRSKIEETADLMIKPSSMDAVQHLAGKDFADLVAIRQNVWVATAKLKKEVQDLADLALSVIDDAGLVFKDFSRSTVPNAFFKVVNGDFKAVVKTAMDAFSGDASFYTAKANTSIKARIDEIAPELSHLGLLVAKKLPEIRLLHHVAPYVDMLALINSLQGHHQDFKQEEELFSISDFDTLINKEVKDQPIPFIYEKVGTWYKHILIDEFQDTSTTQWQNLLPLVLEMVDNKQQTLVVGDAKQAIYRWRGGETTLLTNLPAVNGKEPGEILALDREYEPKPLNSNYRSRANIIDFNNELFTELLKNPAFDSPKIYHEFSQFKTEHTKEGGHVTVELFADDKKDEENAQTSKEKRLTQLVIKVKELISQGYKANQIAILNRTNSLNIACSEALLDAGINIVSQESLLLKNHPLVCLYPALLQWFLQPTNQVIQAQILQQLYNLNGVEGIMHALLAEMQRQKFTTHTAYSKWLQKQGLPISLTDLIGLPYYYLWEALTTQFPEHQNSAFISFFGNALWEIVAANGNNATFILDWWEEKSEKLFLDSAQMTDGVQIMTIHKSKGLEFEAVIIPFADWKLELFTPREWVHIENPAFGDVAQINVPISKGAIEGTQLEPILLANNSNTLLDNYNLLYVATTRAKSELHMYAAAKMFANRMNSVVKLFLGESTSFSKGTPVIIEQEEEARMEKTLNGNYSKAKDVLEKIKIKNRSARIWNEEVSASINYGNAVHSILSFINIEEDVPTALAKAYSQGWITHEDAATIENMLKELIHNEQLTQYFTESTALKNEQKIILPGGQLFIPDRMLLDAESKTAHILDFKTGAQASNHEKQLRNYALTIQEMGYTVKEALLVYMEPLNIKVVSL